MIKIPAFNPGDTTKYPNGNGLINVGAADEGCKMLLYNESPYNIDIDFLNGNISTLHAWEARYWTLDGDTKQVEWAINTTLAFSAPPISQVMGELYRADEKIEGTYPFGLVRQTGVGNVVSTNMGTNQVVNDGNPVVSTVIEATQSGNTGGSNLFAGNDGSFYYGQWVASVYEKYFQGIPGASPVLALGAKLLLQAFDNAGNNLSSILGIDSAGNTFLQAHKTNNKFVLYDKTGTNALLTVSGINTTVQGIDSSNAAGNIFGVDSSGNTFLQAHPTNNQVTLYDKNGSAIAAFNGPNKTLSLTGVTQSVNGDTSGSASVIEGLIGPYKVTIYQQNGYRQAGSANTLTLKNGFTFGAIVFNMGCGGVSVKQAGSVQNIQVITALASGGGTSTPVSAIQTASFGWLVTNFNQFADSGAMGSARSGLVVAIGL